MWFLPRNERNSARRSQAARRVRPVVEGFEPRLLLSGATAATAVISGTTYKDITGNGFSSDDSPHGGVTVELFKVGGSSPIASTVSASDGNYSFTKLAPGNYSVREVQPAGWLQTGGLGGDTVDLTGSGQTVTKQDFDNFDTSLYSTSTISNIQYTVTSPAGKTAHPSSLDGHVQQGDTVTAHFQLSKPEMVELVSYVAPNGNFNTQNLQEQVIFSHAESSTTTTGAQTVTVTVPNGYFQLDFVAGPAIDHLATNSNILYHAQDRFIDGVQGGSQANGLSTLSGSVETTPASGQKIGAGLDNVTVVLTGFDYTGKAVSLMAVTDANGDYTFTGLRASNSAGYRISEIVPTGYVQKSATAGSTGSLGGSNQKFITTFLNTNTSSTGNEFLDSKSNG